MRHLLSILLGVTTLIFASLFSSNASADTFANVYSSCGNLGASAELSCKVEVQGGCTAKCTPINFQAACSGQLYASCDGGCNLSAQASCTGRCDIGTCEASCNVNPGSFDCSANCQADCSANCNASCQSSANQSQCQASCKATCGGKCSASCSGQPPSANCKAKCQASCTGSCNAQANLSCQIDCQSKGYLNCQTNLQGGCTGQCQKPEGALFCNDQFVNAANNLKSCVNSLDAFLTSKVDVSASSSFDCEANTCSAQAEATASCAAIPRPSSGFASGIFLMLGAAVAAVIRSRNSRR